MWGKAGETILWPIYRLQKIIIRIINSISSRTESTPYFTKMEILKLKEIHSLLIGVFMFKYKTKKLPTIFENFFNENNEFHSYPTRGANRLRPPIYKSKIATNFIKKTGTTLWNIIDPIINSKLSLQTFKKHLKKILLANPVAL